MKRLNFMMKKTKTIAQSMKNYWRCWCLKKSAFMCSQQSKPNRISFSSENSFSTSSTMKSLRELSFKSCTETALLDCVKCYASQKRKYLQYHCFLQFQLNRMMLARARRSFIFRIGIFSAAFSNQCQSSHWQVQRKTSILERASSKRLICSSRQALSRILTRKWQ